MFWIWAKRRHKSNEYAAMWMNKNTLLGEASQGSGSINSSPFAMFEIRYFQSALSIQMLRKAATKVKMAKHVNLCLSNIITIVTKHKFLQWLMFKIESHRVCVAFVWFAWTNRNWRKLGFSFGQMHNEYGNAHRSCKLWTKSVADLLCWILTG